MINEFTYMCYCQCFVVSAVIPSQSIDYEAPSFRNTYTSTKIERVESDDGVPPIITSHALMCLGREIGAYQA
jgi:hypothetical protein